MVLCAVDQVKAKVDPQSLTDLDLLDIITEAGFEVSARAGGASTDSNDPYLNQACIHLSVADVLRRLKTNEDLPKSVMQGTGYKLETDVEKDIQLHEDKATTFITRYLWNPSASNSLGGICYSRSGVGTVDAVPITPAAEQSQVLNPTH